MEAILARPSRKGDTPWELHWHSIDQDQVAKRRRARAGVQARGFAPRVPRGTETIVAEPYILEFTFATVNLANHL